MEQGASLLMRYCIMTSPGRAAIATAFQNAIIDTQTLGELVASIQAFHADPAVADAEIELWAELGVQMTRNNWVAAVQGAIAYWAAYPDDARWRQAK